MMTLHLLCSLLLVGAALAKPSSQKVQDSSSLYSRVYSNQFNQGNNAQLDKFTPDLSTVGLDNDIESVHQTGMWIYYDNKDYNTETPGKVFYVHGIDYSYNFPSNYQNMASSARFAGSKDNINQDTITLYQGQYFTGREILCLDDKATLGTNLDQQASSTVVTGQSPWTLYSGENYTSTSHCVYPNTDHDTGNNGETLDYGIYPDITNTGVADNSVRSVRKGCFH